MFRPIRVDHTNCLQVAIKTHSFIERESRRGFPFLLVSFALPVFPQSELPPDTFDSCSSVHPIGTTPSTWINLTNLVKSAPGLRPVI